MKCNFVMSPIGGFDCSVCRYHTDDQALDRECDGAIAAAQTVQQQKTRKRKCCGKGKKPQLTAMQERVQKLDQTIVDTNLSEVDQ